MWQIPNTYSQDTPFGKDDTENTILRSRGTLTTPSFPIKDHTELGTQLDIIDFDSAGIIS